MYVYAQQSKPLPVLLIHGYNSAASVWTDWDKFLTNSQIPHKAVTFPLNDECGSAQDHATQLQKIVEDYRKKMHVDKINIVAHSKGGLDTRIYLSNNISNDAIANFIMIGTPNKGSPVEDEFYLTDKCTPAASDLKTTSNIAKSAESEIHNPHTVYYTIAGNWTHDYIPFTTYDNNCLEPDITWLNSQYVGKSLIKGPSDGLVPLWSSEIKNEYKPLGEIDKCHTRLLNDESYKLAEPILIQ
jgi:uncharacterized alpha/beta hydrolase family protein